MRGSNHAVLVAAAAAALVASPTRLAGAVEGGGSVTGQVVVSDAMKRAEPAVRSQGFVPRIRNPILPTRPFSPFPWLVVFLDDGKPDPADREPPRQQILLELLGESFSPPLLAVVAGTEVTIKNVSSGSPRIYSPQAPELIPPDPINPQGTREVKIDTPLRAIEIRSKDGPHLRGAIVAFPHAYFARVDAAGKFTIDGVPEGRWTVRLWYRDGWLPVKGITVDVVARHAVAVKTIVLPDPLEVVPPDADKPAPDKGDKPEKSG